MDEVCAQCDKSRSGLPSKVAKSLSIAFDAEATVPIIRPDTLAVLAVPRQHVLDCALAKKGNKGAAVFNLPQPSSTKSASNKRKASNADGERPLTRQRVQMTASTADAAAPVSSNLTTSDAKHDDATDVQAVLLQNRSFAQPSPDSAGFDGSTADPNAMMALANKMIHALDDNRGRSSTTFRPTALGQHNALDHPDHQVNMTDFSKKNGFPAVTTEPSYTVLLDALTNLRQFGRTFYNAETVDVLNAAIRFIEEFADGGEPDHETTKRLLLWINMKMGEFRGLVISEGLAAAVCISGEFSLQDPLLAELLYGLQTPKLDTLTALIAAQ
ncbi:hypothetical protein PR001_g12461 [Phytophthora rubi]|uniref:Uncharacterized protein n=1 Tax=Phytophthora rubi TaxID=129364 RepID=A0A6A3MAS4_9STRA|nr:hypothetical protein PR001_g12461 [Phytophthora rubi]